MGKWGHFFLFIGEKRGSRSGGRKNGYEGLLKKFRYFSLEKKVTKSSRLSAIVFVGTTKFLIALLGSLQSLKESDAMKLVPSVECDDCLHSLKKTLEPF